jgi:hypothetical protein
MGIGRGASASVGVGGRRRGGEVGMGVMDAMGVMGVIAETGASGASGASGRGEDGMSAIVSVTAIGGCVTGMRAGTETGTGTGREMGVGTRMGAGSSGIGIAIGIKVGIGTARGRGTGTGTGTGGKMSGVGAERAVGAVDLDDRDETVGRWLVPVFVPLQVTSPLCSTSSIAA